MPLGQPPSEAASYTGAPCEWQGNEALLGSSAPLPI